MKAFALFFVIICVPSVLLADEDSESRALERSILNEVSWAVKLLLLREYFGSSTENNIVVVQDTDIARKKREAPPEEASRHPADDNDMKMKLFRLMYETVRDSDLKVKRAELINSYYVNSTSFEIGYLLGDVTDKFNVITDIAATLKRLYDTWKPIEHINAYEQIANQAIEISHLIEMVRSVNKKGATAQADQSRRS